MTCPAWGELPAQVLFVLCSGLVTPANASQFLSAESANLEYLEVALTDLAQGYTPDEDAPRKAYETDPTRFRSAEECRARHILIAVDADRADAAAKALADEITRKLSKGGDFAVLAAQYSSDAGSQSRGWTGSRALI